MLRFAVSYLAFILGLRLTLAMMILTIGRPGGGCNHRNWLLHHWCGGRDQDWCRHAVGALQGVVHAAKGRATQSSV